MNKTEAIQRVRGIVVFAVTPMTETGFGLAIDEQGVQGNLTFLADAGIPVVVVCGGIGELWDLTDDEHDRVVRSAVESVKGRTFLFAGAYGSKEESIERARRIEKAGADGVLLFPDDDAIPTREALLDYYTSVSKAVDIGLMPFRADDSVDIDTIKRLADLPNVVALKEEKEDMADFRNIVLSAGDLMTIIGAGDVLAPSYFLLGAGALACSLSNILPKLYIEWWEAGQQGDYRRVMEIHTGLAPLERIRKRSGICFLKAALEEIGLAGGPTRSGQRMLDRRDREEMRRFLGPFLD
ncbi:MAG: dihydrodipicolinate synthase family protein [Planctomycetota bacterium]|nr:dihydrodipicolinate synthase family protein [Planctomycetota bacterium]